MFITNSFIKKIFINLCIEWFNPFHNVHVNATLSSRKASYEEPRTKISKK